MGEGAEQPREREKGSYRGAKLEGRLWRKTDGDQQPHLEKVPSRVARGAAVGTGITRGRHRLAKVRLGLGAGISSGLGFEKRG